MFGGDYYSEIANGYDKLSMHQDLRDHKFKIHSKQHMMLLKLIIKYEMKDWVILIILVMNFQMFRIYIDQQLDINSIWKLVIIILTSQ